MLQYFSLLLLSTALAQQECTYSYDDQLYARDTALNIKGLPTNLVYNPNNDELLFTLIDLVSLQKEDEQTKMDQYVLRNAEPKKIDNVNGQSAAVDIPNNKVYIGTDDGLYSLNTSKNANFVAFQGEDIVQLFKANQSNDLYAVLFPDNEVYKVDVQRNEKTKVENVPCAFILAVDQDENIYYECDSKYVKVLLNDFEEPIEFAGIPKNSARAIAVDRRGRAVLAANDGLYHLRPDNMIPSKLMNLEFVPSGIAFGDGDDFYIATNGIIYKYSNNECGSGKV